MNITRDHFLSIFRRATVSVSLIISLFACQTPDQNEQAIRLSGWVSSPSETQLLSSTIDSFRVSNPDIAVKYEPIPGSYSEKIQLMLGTATAPDIFYLKGMTAPSYIRYEVLQPLNSFASQSPDFNSDDFYPFLREAFMQDSVFFGFPKDFNPYVLFYNRKMFQDAGITSPPQNWTELFEISKALTKDLDGDGKIDQWGLVIEPTIEMIMPFVLQNEGYFQAPDGRLAFTEAPFLEALDYYINLYRSKVAALPSEVGAGWNGDAFGRKRCAMIFAGGWVIPFLQDNFPSVEYAIDYLPAGKRRATVAFTTAYVMPKSGKNHQKAWKLLSYLTGKTGMSQWTQLGLAMPSRKSVAIEKGFYNHPTYKYLIGSADFAHSFQVSYVERWYDESQAALQSIFFLNEAPESAMNKLMKRIEKFKL